MFDTITKVGQWVLFTALPFLVGIALLLFPVWLVWEVIYRRRLWAWARWVDRVYPQVQQLGQSWAIDTPPEMASALCYVVWLLSLQEVCRNNRVSRLRWEARPNESWAEYEGRMRVRFAMLQGLLPPDSRLRLTPLKTLLHEVYLATTLGVEKCTVYQEYEAEKEIRRAAWQASQDFRDSDKHRALFAGATGDYWLQRIDGLRENLPVGSPARTKSIEELALEYSDPRWQERE